MTTKECPVCGTGDEKLIRTCQLRAVISRCLGAVRDAALFPVRPDVRDERIVEDGE
jgi:hypothetical protein